MNPAEQSRTKVETLIIDSSFPWRVPKKYEYSFDMEPWTWGVFNVFSYTYLPDFTIWSQGAIKLGGFLILMQYLKKFSAVSADHIGMFNQKIMKLSSMPMSESLVKL